MVMCATGLRLFSFSLQADFKAVAGNRQRLSRQICGLASLGGHSVSSASQTKLLRIARDLVKDEQALTCPEDLLGKDLPTQVCLSHVLPVLSHFERSICS